jgi:hypothetical protein
MRTHRIKPACGTLARYILDVVLFVRDQASGSSPNMIAVKQSPPKASFVTGRRTLLIALALILESFPEIVITSTETVNPRVTKPSASLKLSNALANGVIDANVFVWPNIFGQEDHDCGALPRAPLNGVKHPNSSGVSYGRQPHLGG